MRLAFKTTLVFCAVGCGGDAKVGQSAAHFALNGTWELTALDGRALPHRDRAEPCDARPFFSQIEILDGGWSQLDSTHANCEGGPSLSEYLEQKRITLSADSIVLQSDSSNVFSVTQRLIAFYRGDSIILLGNDMVAAHLVYKRKH